MNSEINPYIAGSPVRTPSMFFGREQLFETVNQHLVECSPGRVIVLHGQRRMGKTSVLYQMVHHVPDHYLPLLIDLQGMSLDGLSSLFWEMTQITRRRLRRLAGIVAPRGDRAAWFADPQSGIKTFFDAIQQDIGDRHIVLMFDETMLIEDKIGAGVLEEGVFSYFSDLISRYQFLDFVFSIGSKVVLMEDRLANLSRPAIYQEISFLGREAAESLIADPVQGVLRYEPQAVDRILGLTSGQPYYTQLVCHELFNHAQTEGRRTVCVADVEQIRPSIVEMATSQLHYVWGETPQLGQRVLLALAEMEDQDGGAASARQIGQFLLKRGVMVSDKALEGCIKDLEQRYIINKSLPYCFRVDLFRYWILKNRRLEWL